MMTQSPVFEDYSVDALLKEFGVIRGDDCYTLLFIQTEVLSTCLMDKLKPAIANCVMHQRKFLSERDVLIAADFPSVIPRSTVMSREHRSLFESAAFKKTCEAHIAVAQDVLQRLHGNMDESIKISSETALLLQELVEKQMRGFVDFLVAHSGGRRVLGYKECTSALSTLVGHGWNA